MKIKETFKKVKDHIRDNKDEYIFWGTITGYVGAVAGMTVYAVKQYNKEVTEYEQAIVNRQKTIESALSRGARILPNPDGSLWIIDQDNTVLS